MSDSQNTTAQEIPQGFCQCGCGQKTKIADRTDRQCGHIKGQPLKYIWRHSTKKYNGVWYKSNTVEGKPRREHILIAEKALGKPLPKGCIVHHANGDKSGGTLVICQNAAYHLFVHQRMRAYEACGHANWRKCVICKKYDDPGNMFIYIGNCDRAYHPSCKRLYEKTMRHKRESLNSID